MCPVCITVCLQNTVSRSDLWSSVLSIKNVTLCLLCAWESCLQCRSSLVVCIIVECSSVQKCLSVFHPCTCFVSNANTLSMCFSGYGLGFLFMASTPVLRSKLSKLVDPSEQGKLNCGNIHFKSNIKYFQSKRITGGWTCIWCIHPALVKRTVLFRLGLDLWIVTGTGHWFITEVN